MPTPGTAAAGGLAFLAWRGASAGGSRLGVFVAVATVAAVVLDLIWAVVTTRRAEVAVRFHETDVVARDRVTATVSVRRVTRCRIGFGPAQTLWAESPGDLPLNGRAPRRSVLTQLGFEVTSRGLCGLAGFTRRRSITLDRPLYVGPRPEAPSAPLPELSGGWGDGRVAPAPGGDVVRGVRAYVAGDPLRHVHWRATARRGDLVVKQVEEPTAPRLDLVLDLGPGGEAGERAASRAAWYTAEARRRGYLVVLSTAESSGPVCGPVTSASATNRRLAAAAVGAPAAPSAPHGRPVSAVLRVSPGGDRWE
ncbi:MAG: DUF58 domain-containing protein [Acidimicrobiales bacterium]